MREVVLMLIVTLSVALWLCLLSGGVEVKVSTQVKVGGKVWFGRKRKRVRHY